MSLADFEGEGRIVTVPRVVRCHRRKAHREADFSRSRPASDT
jgi:hypothetical protein